MLDSFVWVFILTIILLFLIMILKMLVDYPGMSSWKCVYMDPQPDKLEIDLSEYELAAIEIPDKRKHPQIPRPIKHKQKRDELQIFVSEVDSHSSEVISDLTSTSEVLSHHPSEVHSEITASSEASSGIVQDIHTNRNIWDAVTKAAVCDFVTKVDVCDIEKNGCGDTNLDREANSSNSNCLSIEGTKDSDFTDTRAHENDPKNTVIDIEITSRCDMNKQEEDIPFIDVEAEKGKAESLLKDKSREARSM